MFIQGTFREHSGNIQGTFREHSGNLQGTFREHSRDIQGDDVKRLVHEHNVLLQVCRSVVVKLRKHCGQRSGNIQATFREPLGNIQGTFKKLSATCTSAQRTFPNLSQCGSRTLETLRELSSRPSLWYYASGEDSNI
jgi:hypothetical protein